MSGSAAAGLAVLWAAMAGVPTPASLLTGFVLGHLILLALRGPFARSRSAHRVLHAVALLFIFLWEVVLANLRVAWDVITPRHRMRPGVIAVPLKARTELEVTILANMVSLTPGTLSLDVSDQPRVLYVHALYLHDRRRLIRSIQEGFERRLLEVLR